LELNFVPVYPAVVRQLPDESGLKTGEEIEFFCGPKKGTGRWFFDIYIQGSKYNFKS
jgi:hypothetical protein